ncbi:MAG: hypothetical protein CFK52_01705 [Chloracidobacterium sp. CP2_5A]|nr:MAG: hypothetical protein CFK52_01705 [Chloracidobacterium sp. CP2_5A]
MPESIQNQLEASPADGTLVSFQSEGFSFVHPALWQAIRLAGFQYGAQATYGLTILFRFIPAHPPDVLEEATLSLALGDLLDELPTVIRGDKFVTGLYVGLTAQAEAVWRGTPCLIWGVVIARTGPSPADLSRGVLIIIVPTAAIEAGERDARLILDSFAVAGQSVTDARISMSQIESVEFDPSSLIETRQLPGEADVSTMEDLPAQPPEAESAPDWRVSVSTLTASEGGYADGPLAVAKFLRPNGIACDPQGNLYIADFGNHRIRQISMDGVARTLAGSGRAGYQDDLGLLAEFNGPRGIAYASGYLYLADLNNACIRRITLDGAVTTLAGDGLEGACDGLGKQARFKSPRAVAVDAVGVVYVADDARVRRITPDGMVTTLAGCEPGYADGPAAAAKFDTLSGLALDRVGNIYLADAGNRRLRKLSRDGQVTTLPVGPEAKKDVAILHPVALCVGSDGTLYVLDVADFSLKAVLPGGAVARIAGGRQGTQDGDGAHAQFWMPAALALFDNCLYVTDRERHAIRLARLQDPGESPTAQVWPQEDDWSVPHSASPEDLKQTKPSVAVIPALSAPARARQVAPFARQAGLGAADLTNLAVEVAAGGGDPGFLDGQHAAARLNHPVGLAMDADGTLFIADHFNHAIRMLAPDGQLRTLAGGRQRGFRDGRGAEAEFNGPLGIAVGAQGEIYVADHLNARVRVVTRDGEVRTLAGTGVAKIEDGPLTTASFEGPKGIATDMHGLIYVTDGVTVRLITPDGYARTLAGQARGFRDGVGARAMFGWVYAIALDVSGLCFVTDAANHAIRCVYPDGAVKTVFGGGEIRQLNFPNGLAIDVYGNLYVADTNHHRVLRLTPTAEGGYAPSLVCGQRRGRQLGAARETELDAPRGIAVGFDNDLYIADSNANRVLRVVPLRKTTGVESSSGDVADQKPLRDALAQALSEAETASSDQLQPESLHEASSTPVEVAEFAERMEHKAGDGPPLPPPSRRQLDIALAPAAPAAAPAPSPVASPVPHRRHAAATVLGWGIEVSGHNLIRTEPDGSLLLDTTYSAENSAFFYLPWEVTAAQKVIIKIKMQLVAYVGERDATGCAVWFENDRHADALLIQSDGIRLLRAPELSYACNPCAGINAYAITLHGPDIRVAFNGVERITGVGKFWTRPAARDGRPPRRWLAFGDGSSTSGSISRWQSVTYCVEEDADTLPLAAEG